MDRFLRDIEIHRLSFWIGFAAGILAWLFLRLLQPLLLRGWAVLRTQISAARQGLSLGIEVRHRNDTLRFAQGLHLASPLFSLDEIRVEPRLLVPPPRVEPGGDSTYKDLVARTIPFLPDWPELGVAFGERTLTLPEAVSGGADLAIIGQPGSGKTTALADLASRLARRDPDLGELSDRVPILVHAGDLVYVNGADSPNDPLDPLIAVVSSRASTMGTRNLPEFLHSTFRDGRALLLFDGLDELPPVQIDGHIQYLMRLRESYPQINLIVTASPDYIGSLPSLGLMLVAVASWNQEQRSAYINHWGTLWTRFVQPEIWPPKEDDEPESPLQVEPILLSGWLMNDSQALTPLELTLRVWAAYAGDMLGAQAVDGLEAYIRRMTVGIRNARQALEQLSLQMTATLSPIIPRSDAGSFVAVYDQPGDVEAPSESEDDLHLSQVEAEPRVSVRRILPDLLGSGLLLARSGGRISFGHPVFQGYLAGKALSKLDGSEKLLSQPRWSGKTLALSYLSVCGDARIPARHLLERDDEPLHTGLLTVARWLRQGEKSAPWRSVGMRFIAKTLQNDQYALQLRCRLIAALGITGNPEVAVLFRQMLNSDYPRNRQLAALGLGLVRENKSIKDLSQSLYDPTPNVRRAACLALIHIGTAPALETVASALLHGDETLRQAAAEAFANHPDEGYPLLQEGATMDDLLVRRAVVFGLARVNQEWSRVLLEKMAVEDGQWVVRNAATQTLEDLDKPNPLIPRPFPPLHETPWLIAFAGERGMGLTPGKPARALLYLALREGNPEQRLAALERLHEAFDQEIIREVYDMLYGTDPELQEAAFNLLWHLDAQGIDLPSPTQFGLG